MTAIKLNELAEMNYRVNLLGDPQPISDEDIEVFRSRKRGKGKMPRLIATWRYYAELSSA